MLTLEGQPVCSFWAPKLVSTTCHMPSVTFTSTCRRRTSQISTRCFLMLMYQKPRNGSESANWPAFTRMRMPFEDKHPRVSISLATFWRLLQPRLDSASLTRFYIQVAFHVRPFSQHPKIYLRTDGGPSHFLTPQSALPNPTVTICTLMGAQMAGGARARCALQGYRTSA